MAANVAGRRCWLALLGLATFVAATAAAPADGAAGRPIVVMFHAGGFATGGPQLLDRRAVPIARRQGFKAVNVAYPLGDPHAALRAARLEARKYRKRRPVCAYGESAGGTLAARLAQGKLGVDASAAYSPIADLTTFLGGVWGGFVRTQVKGRRTRAPILAMMAADDEPGFTREIRRWARSDHEVRLRRVPGEHLGRGGEYGSNVRRAMRWLARRCG